MTHCSVGTTNCDCRIEGSPMRWGGTAENLIRSLNDTVLAQSVLLRWSQRDVKRKVKRKDWERDQEWIRRMGSEGKTVILGLKEWLPFISESQRQLLELRRLHRRDASSQTLAAILDGALPEWAAGFVGGFFWPAQQRESAQRPLVSNPAVAAWTEHVHVPDTVSEKCWQLKP